tara:strand:+ start:2465 stop:4726 length:2262 start_codon:yes stop_codon:yes gene_type:complete
MINFLITKNFKFYLFLFVYLFTNISFSNAKIYNEIIITGNKRLSVETILMFSGLKTNTDLTENDLNLSIKELYKTDYFKDIQMLKKNNVLQIKITENPIIQNIYIKGIKNKSIIKEIEDVTKKTEKYPFLINKIQDQKNLLINIIRSNGFYFSDLETKIINNQNNSVDIFYIFNLGDRAIIKNINFQGNKIFKDTKLRNVIRSEEGKFWKFITSNKYLDEKRIEVDEFLLTEYYQNKGYYKVNVKSSYAKSLNKKYFELNFNIDAGEKFFFNDISLKLNNNFDKENFKIIEKQLNKIKHKKYSKKRLNDIMDEINNIVLQKEFVFVDTRYDFKLLDDNKIDVEFTFKDLEKTFIEQINVFGNFITDEKVIRNSLIVDEGDAFNQTLFDKSINNIKSKGIFKTVKPNIKNSESGKQKKIIDIMVEESPTGEIFAGAGTGTAGATITAGLKENNYLGRGIKLSTKLTVSENELKGKFSVVNPNFRNTDRSLNTIIESTSADFLSTGGFKTTRTGLGIGTGFEQYSDLFINLDVSLYYEKLETSTNASEHKKKQEGDYLENLLSYSLILNKLDQNFQPTDGYRLAFEQQLPIYSDDLSIVNALRYSKYISLSDNLILSGRFFFKSVNSIDDDVRVSKRVYIPSSNLRGFETGKFGPKDGDEYVGGNFGSSINLNTTVPIVFSENENIDLSLFFDAATLREVDYDSSLESSDIRSATGLAINWYTVIGPLSFSYAIPLMSEPSDKTESFRFRIGTSF